MTRTDRLIALASFVGVFAVLIAIGAAIGLLGAFEILVLLVIALAVSMLISRTLRARRGRPAPTRLT